MAESRGMITALVSGIIVLIILTIVGFVMIQEIGNVEDSLASASESKTVINESGGWVNASDYNLAWNYLDGFTNPVILTAWNGSEVLASGNYSVTDAGVVTNTTNSYGDDAVNFTYTFNYQGTTTSTAQLRSNFSTGIQNISNKLPTVLLIAAVVLILGVLVFLWANYQRMRGMGGTGSSGEL